MVILEGGLGRRSREPFSEARGISLLHLGECRVVLLGLSLHLFVNALLLQLSPSGDALGCKVAAV